MFDSSFCYSVLSFPHADTFIRVVVSRVLLFELPVRLAVLRSRLITSWVRLDILSDRFVVLRVRLITGYPGSSSFVVMPFRRIVMASHRFDVTFHRFDSSTQRGDKSTYINITWSITWCHALIYEEYMKNLSFALCQLKMGSLKSWLVPIRLHEAHGSTRGGRAEDDGKGEREKTTSSSFVFSLPISPCAPFSRYPFLSVLYLLHGDDWGQVSLKTVTYAIALNSSRIPWMIVFMKAEIELDI